MNTKERPLDERLSDAQLKLRNGYDDALSRAVAEARNIINASAPNPIVTAPRDRDVLLFTPRLGGWIRGRFDPDKYAKRPRPYWTNDRERIWGVRAVRDAQPTHWMDLPPDPEAS